MFVASGSTESMVKCIQRDWNWPELESKKSGWELLERHLGVSVRARLMSGRQEWESQRLHTYEKNVGRCTSVLW